jgi:hypothetical protein
MKVTGSQYLTLNPDLKAAGVDPLQHFLVHVCPVGPLREARIIDYEPPPVLPSDWDWQWYVGGYKDLRDAGIDTQAEAEMHYLAYGFREGRWPPPPLPPAPILPPDWDWQKYVAAYEDLRNAGIDTQAEAEAHYLAYGFYEKRWPIGYEVPTTPGLHLILDIPGSGQPVFSGMVSIIDGKKVLVIGTYGGHRGGAQIQRWDGTNLITEKTFSDPKGESVFHLLAADDGVPIASLERYGMMARRDTGNPADPWRLTRNLGDEGASDLSFGIFRNEGPLYCLVCTSSRPTSSVIESGDQGRTWHGKYNFAEGVATQGCGNSDGHRILFSDNENGRPIIRDTNSTIVARRDDLQGRGYTQLCGRDGRWNFAGNNKDAPYGGWIDYWEGGVPRTVFNSNRRYAMWSECDPLSEIRVVLFAAWKEPDADSQVAFSKDGGKTWDSFMVPCSCLFGSHFADGGVYLFGGDWGSGRVYFYKF